MSILYKNARNVRFVLFRINSNEYSVFPSTERYYPYHFFLGQSAKSFHEPRVKLAKKEVIIAGKDQRIISHDLNQLETT